MHSGCQGVEINHEHERISLFLEYIPFCENLDGLGKYASSKVWLVFVVTIVYILFVAIFSTCVYAC